MTEQPPFLEVLISFSKGANHRTYQNHRGTYRVFTGTMSPKYFILLVSHIEIDVYI